MCMLMHQLKTFGKPIESVCASYTCSCYHSTMNQMSPSSPPSSSSSLSLLLLVCQRFMSKNYFNFQNWNRNAAKEKKNHNMKTGKKLFSVHTRNKKIYCYFSLPVCHFSFAVCAAIVVVVVVVGRHWYRCSRQRCTVHHRHSNNKRKRERTRIVCTGKLVILSQKIYICIIDLCRNWAEA